MTTSNFKRAETSALTTRTLLYGPVPVGNVAIVFSGTFSNIDSAAKLEHTLTLEILNASSAYVPRLKDIPIPYGGTSKCPKTVLVAGEYLYVTSDSANKIQAVIDIVERS